MQLTFATTLINEASVAMGSQRYSVRLWVINDIGELLFMPALNLYFDQECLLEVLHAPSKDNLYNPSRLQSNFALRKY